MEHNYRAGRDAMQKDVLATLEKKRKKLDRPIAALFPNDRARIDEIDKIIKRVGAL